MTPLYTKDYNKTTTIIKNFSPLFMTDWEVSSLSPWCKKNIFESLLFCWGCPYYFFRYFQLDVIWKRKDCFETSFHRVSFWILNVNKPWLESSEFDLAPNKLVYVLQPLETTREKIARKGFFMKTSLLSTTLVHQSPVCQRRGQSYLTPMFDQNFIKSFHIIFRSS